MIDLKDLWIGDELIMNSSGRVGRFAGINHDGKARIEVEGKIFLTSANNLQHFKQQEDPFRQIDELLGFRSKRNISPKIEGSKSEIDLHIEILAPHLENELPAMILNYQLSRCKLLLRKLFLKDNPES
jgi:hypothetical protein